MKCYIAWKAFLLFSSSTLHTTSKHGFGVFTFYGLKTLYHKGKCGSKTSVLSDVSAVRYPSILQILQVDKTDNFQRYVSAYTIYIQGTEHFLQERDEDKFDTTAELNQEAGGANQGKANKGGTEFCTSLEVRKERKLQLCGGKRQKVVKGSIRSGNLRMI